MDLQETDVAVPASLTKIVAQIKLHEGYAKAARQRIKELKEEIAAHGRDGPRLAEALRDLRAAREHYKDVMRSSEAAGGNGGALHAEEETIRDARAAIRDLKKKLKSDGGDIKALQLAMVFARMDSDDRAGVFDAMDKYMAAMRLWHGE